MKRVFQLWGLPPQDGLDEQQVLRVLDRILGVQPEYVVAGQTENSRLLRLICDRAHARGVKVHQWASLFSENDHAADFDPIVGADGQPLPRRFGEHFNFRCPSSGRNVEWFIQLQREAMGDIPFDGVFLDRVRYPSFANGAMTCFCPDCVKRYEACGIDVDKVRRMPVRPVGFDGGEHVFDDGDMAAFFSLRAQRITQAVRTVKEAFGEVSLDLFPPGLAYLTGQSLRQLWPLAAFVKPMLYRYTTAPAGLPFEWEAFGDSACLPDVPQQIRQYEAVCPGLMWGVEGGFLPGTAEMTPGRIRESLEVIAQNGGSGVCASWNAVRFPEENLSAFLAFP